MKEEELAIYTRLLTKWKRYELVCCGEEGDTPPTFSGFTDYLCNLYDIEMKQPSPNK